MHFYGFFIISQPLQKISLVCVQVEEKQLDSIPHVQRENVITK